jgi:MoaA/NifB/PqqE/SkfB family radical SAM enzyme
MSADDPLHPAQVAARVVAVAGALGDRPGPLTLELYPTLACNLDCAFCDTTDRHRKPVGELSAERLLELVDEAAAMGCKRVFVLGGGEPLLRRDVVPALFVRAKALGMEGILTTNGTLLHGALAQTLCDIGWDEVHISVDGATPAVHDALRGQRGAFRRTVQNACRLRRLRDAAGRRHPRLAVHTVITNRNHTEVAEILRLAHALGAFRVDFDGLIAYTPEQQAFALSAAERLTLAEAAAAALPLAAALGLATTLERFTAPEAPNRGERLPAAPAAPGLHGAPCLKAWHYLVVQADGRSSPCCVLAGEGGSAAAQSLQALWSSDPFLQRVREGMAQGRPLPRCRECSPNILAHEALIRAHLPEGPHWPST